LYIKNKNLKLKKYIASGVVFAIGLVVIPVLLYFLLNFNFIRLIQLIFTEVPHVHTRSYTTWLFYNLYDFFVFAGIPLTVIFFKQIKKFNRSDILFVSFLITLIIIDLSGSTRGETGRIWAPFLPFFVLPTVAYLTTKIKFSTKLFVGLLILQSLQILVMQEFWVMLW